MGKLRLLVVAGAGAWAGWRFRGSFASFASLRGVGPGSSARRSGKAVTITPADQLEKVRALVELGRERGRDLLQQMLGGTGRAA